MATARRVTQGMEEDIRDVELTLTIDEAKYLMAIAYCYVSGKGEYRKYNDSVHEALEDIGVRQPLFHYKHLQGMISCSDV